MCTGTRIVRPWSAIARVTAWRIHQVAYVLNLCPRWYSNFLVARIKPIFPSWMRSKKGTPRPIYFLATLITNRELAVIRCSRACQPSSICWRNSKRRFGLTLPRANSSRANLPRSMRMANALSSLMSLSKGTRLTSFKYKPIVSSVSILAKSSNASSSSSSMFSERSSSLGSSITLSSSV